MRLVFIGPPGAGKGTQCTRLRDHFGIPHLSTGDILREAKSKGTDLGRRVAPILDSGRLVADDLMIKVVEERLANQDCLEGFILDGFPRSVPQAHALDFRLRFCGKPIHHVLELRVNHEVLRTRLAGRFLEAEEARPEDQPCAISERIRLYESITRPVIEFYKERELLVTIDGESEPDKVFQQILEAIGPTKAT